MQKKSLRLYFSTFLLTLTLASFSFAGEGHCPIAPPPPDDDQESGRVIANTNPSGGDIYQFLKGFWENLTQSRNLF